MADSAAFDFMKLNLLAAIIVTACTSAVADEPTLVPENKPFTIAWEHEREDSTVVYRLMRDSTNVVSELATNLFTISGVTNGLSTIIATVPGLPKGTNNLTVVAVSMLVGASDPSTNLVIKSLGKPSAPQGVRKL